LSELIIIGVSIVGLEFLLRIVDYLLSRKAHRMGNSKKSQNNHKVIKANGKKVEKTRT